MKIEDRERLTAERGRAACKANGYRYYVTLPNGRDAALAPFIHTVAIIADLTEWGYGDRWCYANATDALIGLAEWISRDGEGEPEGWLRHPESGRRRPDGDAAKEWFNP